MSLIGALQYVIITRPEISYSINKACQFPSQPLEGHWTTIKRIMSYLRGTLYHGLHLTHIHLTTPLTVMPFQMQIKVLTLMTENQLQGLAYILVII